MSETSIFSATEKRIAVVTGGNKGIGLEICRQLAGGGVMVILTARDEQKGREAVEKLKSSGLSDVIFHQLDVANPSSSAPLVEFIRAQFGKLDILVNNAGLSGLIVDNEILNALKPEDYYYEKNEAGEIPDWMKKSTKENNQTAEECLKTNYFGTKMTTEALIPLLQLSRSGKIINVSSGLGKLKVLPNEKLKKELSDVASLTEERLADISQCFLKDFKEGLLEQNGWPTSAAAYKVSKILVNAYSRILARKYPNLLINCVNPGYTKTDMSLNRGVLTVEEAAAGPVKLALEDSKSSGLVFDKTEVSSF